MKRARRTRNLHLYIGLTTLVFCVILASQAYVVSGVYAQSEDQDATMQAGVDLTITAFVATQLAPTLTPTPLDVGLVKTNSDWIPIIQKFNNVDMVLVPPASTCFMMGSDVDNDDEKPKHSQCIHQAFWIDRYEVTNAQFDTLDGRADLASAFCDPDQDGVITTQQQARCADHPRENITWIEARAFCEARDARLPTEAEWEYAARGPDSLIYPWGNTFVPDNVVYEGNASAPASVGSRLGGVSWVGAYDLSGNVWEWVNSIYDQDRFPYPYDEIDGRENESNIDSERGLRGNSWIDSANEIHASIRNSNYPDNSDADLGFRCAMSEPSS